jgi:anaerobic glycerol-3-phosphate dehydrogenase C subunit
MKITSKMNLEKWQQVLLHELKHKVRWDTITLQLYSTAACIYEITPLAVIIPENEEDIVTAINVCRQFDIPILPRGAGSSLAGNAVGSAVILDLTQHFQKMEYNSEDRVTSGVGVVLNHLQGFLKSHDRKFGPDPSSGNVCVIGGMLGNNSGGPHTILHGNMFKHVHEISVLLANGKRFQAKNILLNEIDALDEFHQPYYKKIKQLLSDYSDKIEKNRPKVTKNASGYQVWDILTKDSLNMASLFVGSEGTLGVFTEAELKIIHRKKYRGIISFYFQKLEEMGKAIRILRELNASAIEFVDQSFIRFALEHQPDLEKFLPEDVQYLLYVEFEASDIQSIHHLFTQSVAQIVQESQLGQEGASSTDESEIEQILTVRKAATVILNKIEGQDKPLPFVEDAAIHPDYFPQFLIDISKLLQKYTFKFVVFGHAGDGNLHIRPLLNLKNQKIAEVIESFMDEFVDLVIHYNGSLSAEHGDGRLRTPYLEKRFPDLMPLFREIKNLFDPPGIMNPDIIVAKQEVPWNVNLRYNPEYTYTATDSRMDEEKWRLEIEKCHGCGTCREYCPVFVATGEEEATARAKANLLRGIVSGKMPVSLFENKNFFKIMDYCLNCGQCLTDCPTSVDIPGMAILAKEKLHQKRPYHVNEKILQNGRLVSKMASITPPFTNKVLSIKGVRTIMDSFVGIDKRRDFPTFNKQAAVKSGREKTALPLKKDVVLWSGCSAQFNDPQGEHELSIKLLEKLGYRVIVPTWRCCNIAKITYGHLEGAQKDINFNVNILLPYAEKKIPILFTSASCGYAFIKEYMNYFPDRDDLRLISETSIDIHDFLMRSFLKGEFTDKFSPVPMRIIYHDPCHLKSQQNKYGPADLLKLIPELELVDIEDSCCGIAGTFGMKKENYDLSMKIGDPLFTEIDNAHPDQLVSGCGTCQIQLTQGTDIDTIHPMVLLYRSYIQNGN